MATAASKKPAARTRTHALTVRDVAGSSTTAFAESDPSITGSDAKTVIVGDPSAPVRFVIVVHGDGAAAIPAIPPGVLSTVLEADPEEALDSEAAAKIVGLAPGTIEKLAARGVIPSFKAGWRRLYIRRQLLEYRAHLQAKTKTSEARNSDARAAVSTLASAANSLKVHA